MTNALLDLVPASGTVIPVPAVWATNFPVSAAMLATEETPAVIGARPNPTINTLASVPIKLAGHFLYDFYYRIWVIPSLLVANNPQYNVGIPFDIWNAYPYPPTNTITSIVPTTATGLTLDIGPGEVFRAIEQKTVEVTITEAAGISVDAIFQFNFTVGSEKLTFKADIADFVQMVPQIPVKEIWDWKTDNLVSWDGTDQRIALRDSPRLTQSMKVMLKNDADHLRQYDRIFKNLRQLVVIPYYQYSTVATQDSAVTTSKIFLDPTKTDLRAGEFALIYDPVNVQGYLVKLGAEAVDGFNTADPLTFAVQKGWWVAPAYTSRFKDGAGLSMRSVAGTMDVDCPVINARTVFKRPGSTATWPTLNGYPILVNRPLANSDVPEGFELNYETIDFETGTSLIKSSWAHPFVQGKRQFFVDRIARPAEMDFWRDFLYTVRGQQNPFLASTFREDLIPFAMPTASATRLKITNINFKDRYWAHDAYKHIAIELADGRILYREVLSVDNFTDHAELELSTAFGVLPADLAIAKVSFLNLVRLGTDRVTWTHYHTYSVVEFDLRTVDG